ncbi:imelysin family protein [uncultured Paracoccus sp.]|uniref:imelysin family protein n=1 Tax=uncultured Paracoccus sp. TaxID=189685 RepID=UPI00261DC611|nr:imelysin family protein [uncultured Paracoccus sp.]
MRSAGFALALLALAAPARADVAEAVNDVILPAHTRFAERAAALDAAAQSSCNPKELEPLFHAAFDAWMRVQHLRMGPAEEEGRALAVNFWPDPKGSGTRVQRQMLVAQDPVAEYPAEFAQISVAARGFPALERLLFGDTTPEGYGCTLARATAADLSRLADELHDGWRDEFAAVLTQPGAGGPYLSEAEARQALFTQLATGLEVLADQRLGRPLGSFDRPRPELAEAKLSARSLRNIRESLAGLQALALALVPDSPRTQTAFDRAMALAEGLNDPALAGVAEPQGRLKVEILQQAVRATHDATLAEVGRALGVAAGFNATDGD